jgi:hypothetical protein
MRIVGRVIEMKEEKIWFIFKIICMAFFMSAGIVFIATFLQAYMSPTKSILIFINHYHEADAELFVAFLAIAGCAFISLDIKRKMNAMKFEKRIKRCD